MHVAQKRLQIPGIEAQGALIFRADAARSALSSPTGPGVRAAPHLAAAILSPY